MIQVDLPGLSVTNETPPAALFLRDLDGWYDGAEIILNADDFPDREGAEDDELPHIRPRFIQVTLGLVDPGDGMAVFALNDTVMSLQELGREFDLAVTDPLGTRYATVRIAGRIQFPIEREDGVAEVTIPLKARDPKKYGPPVAVAPTGLPVAGTGAPWPAVWPRDWGTAAADGRLTLTNEGTAATVPSFCVSGGMAAGFELRASTGGIKRFERVIPDGSIVTLDQLEGVASMDGDTNIVSTYLTTDDLFVVPPRGTLTVQFTSLGATTGDPQLWPILRPAYR